nr:hypothetical protein [Pandoravirus massiliensis]
MGNGSAGCAVCAFCTQTFSLFLLFLCISQDASAYNKKKVGRDIKMHKGTEGWREKKPIKEVPAMVAQCDSKVARVIKIAIGAGGAIHVWVERKPGQCRSHGNLLA